MDIPHYIKVDKGFLEIHFKGHVYSETVTGYKIDGKPAALEQLPLQVRYLFAQEKVGYAPY